MALQLVKNLPNGYSYSYHKLLSVTFIDQKVRLVVESYKDQTAREGGKKPVFVLVHQIDRNDFNFTEPTHLQAYVALKASGAPFENAEDC